VFVIYNVSTDTCRAAGSDTLLGAN